MWIDYFKFNLENFKIMGMKLYKLKHLPTGLFYTPSKGSGNLSTKGKIYVNLIPKLDWCKQVRIIFHPEVKSKKNKVLSETFNVDLTKYRVDEIFRTKPEDWEIIEI